MVVYTHNPGCERNRRSEALFYYFRLEDQVPENHLLRLIEKHISFAENVAPS